MQLLTDYFPAVMAAVGFGAWLVRLEVRASQTVKDLKALEERLARQRQEDLARQTREWEAMTARLDALAAKVDLVPDRVLALLRDR